MKLETSLPWIAAVALALVACDASPTDGGEPDCSTDVDCATGEVCTTAGECRTLCFYDSQCANDEICDASAGWCVTETQSCVTDTDCERPRDCQFAEGSRCNEQICTYIAKAAGTPCEDGDPCTSDDQCDGLGFCAGTNTDCASGIACEEDADCQAAASSCQTVADAECLDGLCHFGSLAAGTPCEPESICFNSATCDGQGQCVNDADDRRCVSPPDSSCDPTDALYTSYPAVGSCDASTGDCTYESQEIACPACSTTCLVECAGVVCADIDGGCGFLGACVGGQPAQCSYQQADEGAACDLEGDPPGSGRGFCAAGSCVGCSSVAHCTELPGPEPSCYEVACVDGACQYDLLLGTACDDGDLCTYDTTCTSAGECSGSPVTCDDAPETCGERRSCDGTATCVVSIPDTSTGCDDGDLCTHGDHCDGSGSCVGTAITCTDDAGTCAINRACDGTASCAATYPGSGTPCDDGNACTHGDHCDGGGACVGTAISCTNDAGTCGADRACNGSSSCTVTYPGTGTTCNDSNACTYSDHCNGSGQCVGTSITCNDDAGTCGANRSCNGGSSCTVSYPGSGTGCSDGNACTTGDHCNGAGACVGTVAANGTQCGGNAYIFCCSGVCVDGGLDANHCGGCDVNCASIGMTCQATNGAYACGHCTSTQTCKNMLDDLATCWVNGGVDFCQCQCPGDIASCADAGCGAGFICHDIPGDNYCAPF